MAQQKRLPLDETEAPANLPAGALITDHGLRAISRLDMLSYQVFVRVLGAMDEDNTVVMTEKFTRKLAMTLSTDEIEIRTEMARMAGHGILARRDEQTFKVSSEVAVRIGEPENGTPTSLYRHFSDRGDLLYVGIAKSSIQRLAAHTRSSQWIDDVARIEIEKYPSRRAAEAAERKAIQEEKPLWNRAHAE